MSDKRKLTERGYCTQCGRWLDKGETHDWEKHVEKPYPDK